MVNKRNGSNFFTRKGTSLSIMLVYTFVTMMIAVVFYPLIPIILNYPPGTINTRFDWEVSSIPYLYQYILIIAFFVFASSVFFMILFRGIDDWKHLDQNNESDLKKLKLIRKKCINLPYIIYVAQILLPITALLILYSILGFWDAATLKLTVILFSFCTLAATVSFIFSKGIFTNILLKTFIDSEREGIRINIKNKIMLQVLPMFLVAILFTCLVGYSRIIKEKEELIFKAYKIALDDAFSDVSRISSPEDIENRFEELELVNKGDVKFIISPSGDVTTSDGSQLSSFFVKYAMELSDMYNGRVYDTYGVDTQGAIVKIMGSDGHWMFGIKYDVASKETLTYFVVSFVLLFFLNLAVLYYFSKTMAGEISLIVGNLSEIAQGVYIDLKQKLAVTSNDEIGDLVIAFNKIQEREKEYIKSLSEKQAILMEQERLASLGQLMGGIAHNLKTPIMSISGGIEALKDLTKEYEESIGDESVSVEDHHEIARDMMEWLDKMKPYCSYMSDIITTVKGQAVQFNTLSNISFTLDELIKRVGLLMRHELKRYHCTLSVNSGVDMKTELRGDVNSLVQIFDNLIVNAIDAYEGKSGTIDLLIKKDDNNIVFMLRDYGKGISNDIKDRLFREMVTTKGTKGTGLGLYMSYANIKGRFGGRMWFESEENKGTTFYIAIPRNQELGSQEVVG